MKYVKLKIDDVPNLDLISQKLQISRADIIEFHNSQCDFWDLLHKEIPTYVEHLFLPEDKYVIWQNNQLPSSTIVAPQFSKASYGVVIKQPTNSLKIHYLIDEYKDENTTTFTKHKLFVNDNAVELMIEKLTEMAGNALDVIQLKTKSDGSYVELLNFEEIQNKWKTNYRPKIEQYYKGEIAEDKVKYFNKFYSELNKSGDFLKANTFFTFFFLPIYGQYFNFERDEFITLYIPTLKKLIKYKSKFSLSKTYTENNRINIRVLGGQVFDETGDFAVGTLEFNYNLDKINHTISSITGFYTYFDDEDQEVKTEIEIYKMNY